MDVESVKFLTAELPRYEPPPEWVPPDQRQNNSSYNNDLQKFLPRSVTLTRSHTTDQLGFNVRGGREHHCGIYISKIMPNTEAEHLGLQEGDQILHVNEVNFEDIEHAEAVRVLKMTLNVQLTVRFFPYGYEKTYDKTRYYSSITNQANNTSPISMSSTRSAGYGKTLPASHSDYQNINSANVSSYSAAPHGEASSVSYQDHHPADDRNPYRPQSQDNQSPQRGYQQPIHDHESVGYYHQSGPQPQHMAKYNQDFDYDRNVYTSSSVHP